MSFALMLYELQQIDLEIQKKQEILEEIDSQLGESQALLDARAGLCVAQEHLAAVEKQQRDMEWEVEDLQTSISQLSDKLYGGKVKDPKELVSLDQEMNIFKARAKEKEDILLDLMGEVEATGGKIKIDTEQLKKVEQEWQQEQDVLVQRQSEVKAQHLDSSQERQSKASVINSEALNLYEGLKVKKGLAVVRVEQGRCQGCRLNLPMNELRQVRAGNLVKCSSCGRILCLS